MKSLTEYHEIFEENCTVYLILGKNLKIALEKLKSSFQNTYNGI